MFKLIKILGAKCNAPEIVEVETEFGFECIPGRFYNLDGGSMFDCDGDETSLMFAPIERVTGKGTGTVIKVKGYYVTEDMVFETKLYGGLGNIRSGSLISPYQNDVDIVMGVSSAVGTFDYVMDTKDYENTGNITVRIAK